jgi:hypothetical protein
MRQTCYAVLKFPFKQKTLLVLPITLWAIAHPPNEHFTP